MRVQRIFGASFLSLSETERTLPRWLGMAGLRHKVRHNNRRSFLGRVWWWARNWAQSTASPETPWRDPSSAESFGGSSPWQDCGDSLMQFMYVLSGVSAHEARIAHQALSKAAKRGDVRRSRKLPTAWKAESQKTWK